MIQLLLLDINCRLEPAFKQDLWLVRLYCLSQTMFTIPCFLVRAIECEAAGSQEELKLMDDITKS